MVPLDLFSYVPASIPSIASTNLSSVRDSHDHCDRETAEAIHSQSGSESGMRLKYESSIDPAAILKFKLRSIRNIRVLRHCSL